MTAADGVDPLVVHVPADRVPEVVRVRRWVTSALPHVDYGRLLAVMMVTTELVTNVFDHTRGPCRVRMRHTVDPHRIRIEVDDHSAHPPAVTGSPTGPCRGRGLTVVSALSRDWGHRVLPDGSGKTVWAVIDCECEPQPSDIPHDAAPV